MSLYLWVNHVDPSTGEPQQEEIGPPGPESFRHKLYSSKSVRALGMTLLPSLAVGNIHARDEELDLLELEAEVLSEKAEVIAQKTGLDQDNIESRARIILDGVKRARQVQGEVYIG